MKVHKIFSLTVALLAMASVTRADEKSAIAAVEKLGGRVLYIAKDSKEYSVTITKNLFGKEKGFTAADAKLLGELSNAVEVSFQHPDTDDAWVAPLKGLKNLKKLHLEKTKITDKALDTVGAIGSLGLSVMDITLSPRNCFRVNCFSPTTALCWRCSLLPVRPGQPTWAPAPRRRWRNALRSVT